MYAQKSKWNIDRIAEEETDTSREQTELNSKPKRIARRPGDGALSQQDCHSNQMFRQYPEATSGSGGTELHTSWAPRTTFRSYDTDGYVHESGRLLHARQYYDRLYKHHHNLYVPYQTREADERSRKRRRFEDRIRFAQAVADNLVNRRQREVVVALISRSDFDLCEGSLRAYSIEEIALGLACIVLARDRACVGKSYSFTELRSIEEEKHDRIRELREQFDLSKQELSTVKRAICRQLELSKQQ